MLRLFWRRELPWFVRGDQVKICKKMIAIMKTSTNLRINMQGNSFKDFGTYYTKGNALLFTETTINRNNDACDYAVFIAPDGQLCYVYDGVDGYPNVFEVIK